MKLNHALSQAATHGDFYLFYRKLGGQGTTYLVGTTDFDNKYIQAKHAAGKSGIRPSLSLESAQAEAASENAILVWSWTNDKFRMISAQDIRRMSPLAAELKNGRNR